MESIQCETILCKIVKKHNSYLEKKNKDLLAQIMELKNENYLKLRENEDFKKKADKSLLEKDEEISCLRDHNQKLLLQIRKVKDKTQYNQNLEEGIRDFQKKLLDNIEENGHLKKHKQDLMDQIQKLKDDEKSREEMIRNLKNDKDSLENKLDQIQRTSKPSDSKIQVEEKEANTNSILVNELGWLELYRLQLPT